MGCACSFFYNAVVAREKLCCSIARVISSELSSLDEMKNRWFLRVCWGSIFHVFGVPGSVLFCPTVVLIQPFVQLSLNHSLRAPSVATMKHQTPDYFTPGHKKFGPT